MTPNTVYNSSANPKVINFNEPVRDIWMAGYLVV
jgi:hypothetical protein